MIKRGNAQNGPKGGTRTKNQKNPSLPINRKTVSKCKTQNSSFIAFLTQFTEPNTSLGSQVSFYTREGKLEPLGQAVRILYQEAMF